MWMPSAKRLKTCLATPEHQSFERISLKLTYAQVYVVFSLEVVSLMSICIDFFIGSGHLRPT